MQKSSLILAAILGISLFSFPLFSQEDAQNDDTSVYRYFDISPDLRLWGALTDLELGLRFIPGLDTGVWMRGGLAYETLGYYQDSAGYTLKPGDEALNEADMNYSRWDFRGGLGIFQGLHFNEKTDRNDLELLAAWMYEYDIMDPSLSSNQLLYKSDQAIKDSAGLSYLLLSLAYQGSTKNDWSKNKDGIDSELWLEASPEGWTANSETSWMRVGTYVQAYLPLFSESKQVKTKDAEEEWNIISSYLAFNVTADQLFALNDAQLPSQISYIVGGKDYRAGIGGLVRGVADGYLSGTTKLASNIEYRLHLPALLHKDLVPSFVAYFDGGVSWNALDEFQWILGSGVGIFVDLFNIVDFGIYTQWVFPGLNELGQTWIPLAIGFGYQF